MSLASLIMFRNINVYYHEIYMLWTKKTFWNEKVLKKKEVWKEKYGFIEKVMRMWIFNKPND
jgi:hypothetical protein